MLALPDLQRVALLAEGVDRNHDYFTSALPSPVALLAEGVDRNVNAQIFSPFDASVALLAEGVDRNLALRLVCLRRLVALLAEGVDRNTPRACCPLLRGSRPPRGGRG